jgi:hypothetical protein
MFDEPMPDLMLPEAMVSEGERDALLLGFDMELDDWSEDELIDEVFVFSHMSLHRGISAASTAVGDDISNCPSPESDSSKSSASSNCEKTSKHPMSMTMFKGGQAFALEQVPMALTCQ